MEFNNLLNKGDSIVVSTDKLSEKSIQIKNICGDIITHIKLAEECVNNSKCYWSTEGGELLRSLFKADKEETEDIAKRLAVQIEKLNKIIAVYNSGEDKASEDAQNLPNSVIN